MMIKRIKKYIKNSINKISNIIFSHPIFKRKFDDIKLQNGLLFSQILESKLNSIKSLDEIDFKVFSQNNEDGILEFLIKTLKLKDLKFVEIGTQDYSESNTRYIYEKYNCDGLIIDNTSNLKEKISKLLDTWKGNLIIEENTVNKNNINSLLDKHSFNYELDIFSIDIDGIDYWILKELPPGISKILVAEYNPYFGPTLEITVPYSETFDRSNYHKSNLCWGMSLKALIKLMEIKDFEFIGSNSLRNNAFFVKREYLKVLAIEKVDTSNLKNFTNARYRENRDYNGKLMLTNPNKNIEVMKDCEVVNLETNKICTIKELISNNL